MERDYGANRDDLRRQGRADDDPRRDPRERYGNEEDQYSRDTRRAYSEHDLPRRMHDDRPYNQAGYEPEGGRPGGRENVELDRGRNRSGGAGMPDTRFQGRYDDRNQRGSGGGDPYGYDWEQPVGERGQRRSSGNNSEGWRGGQGETWGQGQRFGQGRDQSGWPGQVTSGYNSGRPASPYDEGELGSWYGGTTGMGEAGSSLDQQSHGNTGRGQQRQSRSFEARPFEQARQGGQSMRHDQHGGHQGHEYEGPFSGRGPRGYQRSDERIREDVCELLTRHGDIDASSMEVEVRHGTVTLRGMADSGRTRRLTEEVVEEVSGVQDVENQLRVNQRTGYSATSGTDQGGSQSSSGMRGSQTQSQSQSHGQPQTHSTPAYGAGVAETSGVSTRTGPGEPGISAGGGPSQHGNRWQIRETMDVVGSDGENVGSVKAVRGTDFQVDRPMSRDLYVPFSAVRTVDSERVLLNCRAAEVDQQNWPAASLTGASETPPAR